MLEEMDGNRETLLDELNDFEKHPVEISALLEEYLIRIARTGDTMFPWVKLKPLLKKKAEIVLEEFYEISPTDSLPALPNVEVFKFDVLKSKILEAIETFQSAPFTIQRICELLTNPRKHYKRTDKFMRGLEKNILVVSTVEPLFGIEMNNNSASAVMNGMVSGENDQALIKGINSPDMSFSDDSPPHDSLGDMIPSSYIVVDETSDPIESVDDEESEIDNKACMDSSSYADASVHDEEDECYADHHSNIDKSTVSFNHQNSSNGPEHDPTCMDVSLYTEASINDGDEEEGYSDHHRNKTTSNPNSPHDSSPEKFSSFTHSSSADINSLPQSDNCDLKDPGQKLNSENDQKIRSVDSHSGLLKENVLLEASSVLVEEIPYMQRKQDTVSSPEPDIEVGGSEDHEVELERPPEYKNEEQSESVSDKQPESNTVRSHSPENICCQQQVQETFEHCPHSPETSCQTQSSEKIDHIPHSPGSSEILKVKKVQTQSLNDAIHKIQSETDLKCSLPSNENECNPKSSDCADVPSPDSSSFMQQSLDSFVQNQGSPTQFKFQPHSPEEPDSPHSIENCACHSQPSDDLLHRSCSPSALQCQPQSPGNPDYHSDISSNSECQLQSSNDQRKNDQTQACDNLEGGSHPHNDLDSLSNSHSILAQTKQSSDDLAPSCTPSDTIDQLQSNNDVILNPELSSDDLMMQPPSDDLKSDEHIRNHSIPPSNYENRSQNFDESLDQQLHPEKSPEQSDSSGNACISQSSDLPINESSLHDNHVSQSEDTKIHNYSANESNSSLQSVDDSVNQPPSPVYSENQAQPHYSTEQAQPSYSTDHAQPALSEDQCCTQIYPEGHEQSPINFVCQLPINAYQNHIAVDSNAETAMEENGMENNACENVRNSGIEAPEQEMMDVEYTMMKTESRDFVQNNGELTNETEAMEEG